MKTIRIESEADIVSVRQAVRELAKDLGFSIVQQTKIVTAASELARNALDYARGGTVRAECLERGARSGVRVIVDDQGPGIADVEEALTDGFTTGTGFGHGLGGARRLADEFQIHSTPGEGTRITIIRWMS